MTFGILVGTGAGVAYTATFVAIGHYFERRRPLALGLMYLGDAASGMACGPLFTYSLRQVASGMACSPLFTYSPRYIASGVACGLWSCGLLYIFSLPLNQMYMLLCQVNLLNLI